MRESLRAAFSLWNQSLPVNQLPPTLIAYIALHVPGQDQRDAREMIPVTHVCRYWRNCIVSEPRNWTRISSRQVGLAESSLERRPAVPLELTLGVYWFEGWFCDLIAPHVKDIKALHIDCDNDLTGRMFARTLQKFLSSMPNLQSISLSADPKRWPPSNTSDDPCGQLKSPLTCLRLSDDIPLYPSLLSLSTLTSLEVCVVSSSGTTWTPFWTFWSKIARLNTHIYACDLLNLPSEIPGAGSRSRTNFDICG